MMMRETKLNRAPGLMMGLAISVAIASAPLILVNTSAPAKAQAASAPKCMILNGVSVILPARDAAALSAKGFFPQNCNVAFPDAAAMESWRNQVCLMASDPDPEIQRLFTRKLGESPAVLCGMAEAIAGSWRGN